jgi:flagellar basal body-associated protein FliL
MTIALIILAILATLLAAGIAFIACVRSSQISQAEEEWKRKHGA